MVQSYLRGRTEVPWEAKARTSIFGANLSLLLGEDALQCSKGSAAVKCGVIGWCVARKRSFGNTTPFMCFESSYTGIRPRL